MCRVERATLSLQESHGQRDGPSSRSTGLLLKMHLEAVREIARRALSDAIRDAVIRRHVLAYGSLRTRDGNDQASRHRGVGVPPRHRRGDVRRDRMGSARSACRRSALGRQEDRGDHIKWTSIRSSSDGCGSGAISLPSSSSRSTATSQKLPINPETYLHDEGPQDHLWVKRSTSSRDENRIRRLSPRCWGERQQAPGLPIVQDVLIRSARLHPAERRTWTAEALESLPWFTRTCSYARGLLGGFP